MIRPPLLVGEELVAWSLERERDTGEDSIPTVRDVYERAPSGAILCVWPGCSFARRDEVAMWWHVHYSPTHRPAP